jgi:hypothetical protein
MATRAEKFRYAAERSHEDRPPTKKRVKPLPSTLVGSKHAARKATHAFEPHPPEVQPSRKSTRGSANRAKPDAPFNLRESLVKNSPKARHGRGAGKRSPLARGRR